MPDVAKLSAGYYACPAMDLIDLFIGSEGTLGVIVEATLRVIPRLRRAVVLIRCDDDGQAVAVTGALRGEPTVSAIEYMDARALRVVPDDIFARAGPDQTRRRFRPADGPDRDRIRRSAAFGPASGDARLLRRGDEATIAAPRR